MDRYLYITIINNIISINIIIIHFFTTGHDVLSIELMRRYIEYAKQYIHPTLSIAAAKVLQLQYLSMRAQSALGKSTPVTTRHLESLIRLAH